MVSINMNETITLTFGNQAENHKGMEIMGKDVKKGLSYDDLCKARKFFQSRGAKCYLVDLKDLLIEEHLDLSKIEDAHLLIVKDGVNYLTDDYWDDDDSLVQTHFSDRLMEEQQTLSRDTKAFMYGRVVDKKARHNLCFSDYSQEADFPNKKGTVVNFDTLPLLKSVREAIPSIIPNNDSIVNLQCEGNYYYDVKKTYIGYHGDTERKIVIAIRLGHDFDLSYRWYKDGSPVGYTFRETLFHGDIYIMSDKAVGHDWKSRSKYTLRHSAGDSSNVDK